MILLFTDIEEGRKRYLEILRQYGLYSDIEKNRMFWYTTC